MTRRTASADDVSAAVYDLADRLAEQDRRTTLATGLGTNDARLLRHLAAADSGTDHTPATIARYLGISSASVTALIDRLETAGFVERLPHPRDRRSVVIRTTLDRDSAVSHRLGAAQRTILGAAERLSSDDRGTIIAFLDEVSRRLD